METVHSNDESFENVEADTSNESTQHSDEEFAESDKRVAFRPHRLGYDLMTHGSELSHEKVWKELEAISSESKRRNMKNFTGKSEERDHKTPQIPSILIVFPQKSLSMILKFLLVGYVPRLQDFREHPSDKLPRWHY